MEGLVVGADLPHPEAWNYNFKVMDIIKKSETLIEVDAFQFPYGATWNDVANYYEALQKAPNLKKYLAIQTIIHPWVKVRYRINFIVPKILPALPDYQGQPWHLDDNYQGSDFFILRALH